MSSGRINQLKASQELFNRMTGSKELILRKETGRPYLNSGKFNLSISHSRDEIALIQSTSNPVAIDIESTHRSVERVANKFTTEAELGFVGEFFKSNPAIFIWGCKECLFKILGIKAVHFAEQLQCVGHHKNDVIQSKWYVDHPEFVGYYKINSFIFEDTIVSYINSLPFNE